MIPTRLSIYRSGLEPSLDQLIEFLESRLKSDLHGLNVEAISSRKKTPASIQQKLQTGKVKEVGDLRDLAGLTVVLLFRHEIPEAIDILKKTDLQIDDPGPDEVPPSDFRYREPKLFIRPPRSYLERNPHLTVQECEVQFTTALQHALDKATHDFDYKGRSYSWGNFRLVAQMRGILEMVDRTIDGIESLEITEDPTVTTPQRMVAAAELLPVLESHFRDSMPDDRRRFAETVLNWITAAGLSTPELNLALTQSADLLAARSIDATSATLGAILRVSSEALLSNFEGRFLVSDELGTLCSEADAIPIDRRVGGL